MELLYELSDKKINTISLDFVRYLVSQINWKHRLIAIKGARGIRVNLTKQGIYYLLIIKSFPLVICTKFSQCLNANT